RSRIVSIFSDAVASAKIPVLDLATRYTELGDALLPVINPILAAKYGIEFTSFVLENASVPPEVEAAIDKRSSMGAVGNLNDYVKFQMAQGMAQGGGGGAPAEMAMGFAMAQEMMKNTNLSAAGAPQAPTPAVAATGGGVDVLTPAQVAQTLGVTEQDVIASIDAGDLKGKKIGTQYRVTKAALDEFLKH
ncbi:MAG TPA: SPFH and helix-turn-helix domain-containing protein, partial [Verrucomicrobiaceae bacterium]